MNFENKLLGKNGNAEFDNFAASKQHKSDIVDAGYGIENASFSQAIIVLPEVTICSTSVDQFR